MKKWIGIGAFCLAFFGMCVWWFLSLGRLPAVAEPLMTLTVERDSVEVRRAPSNHWVAAASGDEVKNGDEIRTASDGAATIHFFGIGESRLASSSEMSIFAAASTQISLHLSVGRVWTRVLRLLDLDSSFAVRTNSVAATVPRWALSVERWPAALISSPPAPSPSAQAKRAPVCIPRHS